MGLLDSIGDVINNLRHAGERAVGETIDGAAHGVGSGLSALGMTGLAHRLDQMGDHAAYHLGVVIAEKQLGETDDPTELLHGDLGAITQAAETLRRFTTAFNETSDGLAAIDTS